MPDLESTGANRVINSVDNDMIDAYVAEHAPGLELLQVRTFAQDNGNPAFAIMLPEDMPNYPSALLLCCTAGKLLRIACDLHDIPELDAATAALERLAVRLNAEG